MNLKDAFRAQNKLQELMDEATYILADPRNILTVKTTHLRSKVVADAEDAVILETSPGEYAGQANRVADFLVAMLKEREKLSAAIAMAKAGLSMDMDSETGLNRQRQRLASTFRDMLAQRNGEKLITNGGTGYRFNGEGNQITYRCDARQVTTINFDRDKIRAMAEKMSKCADETSAALDRCLINSEVDYTLPFDINASIDDILADFISKTV